MHMYAGKHCCLWCLISQADLKIPLEIEVDAPPGLYSAYVMTTNGSLIVVAISNMQSCSTTLLVNHSSTFPWRRYICTCTYMYYMYKYMYILPTIIHTIVQVCIPAGLHISLGIFNRLYNLLEDACHELDSLQTETDTGAESQGGTSFGRYSAALRKLTEL